MTPAPGALKAEDLMTLERYARERAGFRARVLEHKRARTVAVGPSMTWVFEDRLTIQYQVQEMLRIERIFEPAGIQEELDAYNPLVPDGGNWKATMMIEYPDPAERAAALARLRGIEDHCYVAVEGHGRTVAVADEDLERENAEKTSAVHWLRFELPGAARAAIRAGAAVAAGVDHPSYRHETRLSAATIASLARDFA
ncbi:MAG TPA: DUF3501 family protein [Steroidobacteraceae bacterium]|nr:DUF3501 family protein [Steroidobacteraceae bacterium]